MLGLSEALGGLQGLCSGSWSACILPLVACLSGKRNLRNFPCLWSWRKWAILEKVRIYSWRRVTPSCDLKLGFLILTKAMFLSSVREKMGLECADDDTVANLVGISTSGMQRRLCCTEFPMGSVTCKGFPWGSLPSQLSAVWYLSRVCNIPRCWTWSTNGTCILLGIWQRP